MNAPNDSNIKFNKELFLVHTGEEFFFSQIINGMIQIVESVSLM